MSWLSDLVLPRLNDSALLPSSSLRSELLASARGDVLELGFGTGLNVPHYGPEVRRVRAVEPSPSMWRRGEERAKEAGLDVVRIDAFGESLPVEDASVDTVVSTFVLCSVRDPERVLAEAARVLRPGGALFLLEHVKSPAKWTQRAQAWVSPVWTRVLGGCVPGRDLGATLERSPFHAEEARAVSLPRVPSVVRHALFARLRAGAPS